MKVKHKHTSFHIAACSARYDILSFLYQNFIFYADVLATYIDTALLQGHVLKYMLR